jgi:IS1 family transposase
MFSMANVLSTSDRAAVVVALMEGKSIRATSRIIGVARNTVTKLLLDLADACAKYSDAHLRELPCRRLQVDEAWAFCYAKAKNVPVEHRGTFSYGDVWTFGAIDAETKLIASWLVGPRDGGSATELMQGLAGRLSGRPQVTTDGLSVYVGAVEDAFDAGVDYAQLQKIYASAPGEVRYSRLTNAFSKKLENHVAAVALHFFHYNFCRPHMSLKGRTPAQAAGVESRKWTVAELVGLLSDSRN